MLMLKVIIHAVKFHKNKRSLPRKLIFLGRLSVFKFYSDSFEQLHTAYPLLLHFGLVSHRLATNKDGD